MDVPDRLVAIGADLALGVVFAAVLVAQAFAIAGSWGHPYWLFDCVAGALVCALAVTWPRSARRSRAWTRRLPSCARRPLGSFLAQEPPCSSVQTPAARSVTAGLAVAAVAVVVARVADLPSEPGLAMALGLSVLVGASVRVLPPRPAIAVAAGAAVVVAVSWLAARPVANGIPPVVTLNVAAWLAALVVGLCLRLLDVRRHALAEEARRDERLELARELHDVVAHHITGVVLQAQAARVVRRRHPERLDDSLTGIESAGAEALAAMRRVVGLLRDTDDAVSVAPGPEPLGELVSRFTGPAVRLRLPSGSTEWPPEVASTVYRVVQESLTNVARHAPRARSVAVTVAHEGPAVTVEVADDAPPAPAPHRRGYGLVGMRERVEALGGTLRAGPRPGTGWAVRAVLPLGEGR